jgi:capsular polysaccharide biosynthesis protein
VPVQYYLDVLSRRWRLLVGCILAVGLLGAATLPLTYNNYTATVGFVVSVPDEPRVGTDYYMYNNLYAWQTSEYLIDDLGEVMKSRAFLSDVKQEVGDPNLDVVNLSRDVGTRRTHRVLRFTVTARTAQDAYRFAEGAVRVIEKKGAEYFAQLGADRARARVIDPPTVTWNLLSLRAGLDLAARVLLGGILGLTLVALAEMLDTTIRTGRQVEELLGLPVLAEVPVMDRARG